jgi:hypothetical protein
MEGYGRYETASEKYRSQAYPLFCGKVKDTALQ